MTQLPGLDCNQVVELVTDHVEGRLDAVTAQRVREHLAGCPGCDLYLEQIRRTIQVVGQVSAESLPEQAQAELLAAFRDFHRAD